jgi:hypothetical protein
MTKQILTVDRLREIIEYDPENGNLWWLEPAQARKMDRPAGSVGKDGRISVMINGVRCKAYRVAWAIVFNEWPVGHLDHKNGDPSDNRVENLRIVNHSENAQNQRRPQKRNKCGFLGVSEKKGAWEASIKIHGKSLYLGRFHSPELAHEAYLLAKRIHHPCCTI